MKTPPSIACSGAFSTHATIFRSGVEAGLTGSSPAFGCGDYDPVGENKIAPALPRRWFAGIVYLQSESLSVLPQPGVWEPAGIQ